MLKQLIRAIFHFITIVNIAMFAARFVTPHAAARILLVTFLLWAVIELGWYGGDKNYDTSTHYYD